ncbi:MAG: anti-sigma factor [Chloroflexi bacterium]|nr:anti-sigma factor [Chloroflexota bacterium]
MNHDHNHSGHQPGESRQCQDLLGNLSNFIDGELDEAMCQELQQHMAGCENCRVVYDTTTRTIYLYQSAASETNLPADVRGRLFDTLKLDDLLKPKG